MKIGFLVKDITISGGVERVVTTLANHFSSVYGYRVNIYSLSKKRNDSLPYDLHSSISVKYLGYKVSSLDKSYKACLKELAFLYKKLRKEQIDILITTTTFHNVYFSIMAPILKYKVIGSHHEEYQSDTSKWNRLKKIFYRNLHGVVVLTQSDYMNYRKYNHNVRVIPNSIPFKREYAFNEKNKKIIMVGRLSSEKSMEYGIKGFAQLVNKHTEWELEIIGDGPQKDNLNNLIENLNLDKKVYITNFTKNIEQKYKEAAFTMLTSQKEGFGCVLIESFAKGIPVISFNNVGPSAIIQHYQNGFLVKKNDLNVLVEMMDIIMSNDQLRSNLSECAYSSSYKYTITNVMQLWANLINDTGEELE